MFICVCESGKWTEGGVPLSTMLGACDAENEVEPKREERRLLTHCQRALGIAIWAEHLVLHTPLAAPLCCDNC